MLFSHIAILVSDLDRMENFYRDTFSMRTLYKRNGEKAYLTTRNGDNFGLQVSKNFENKKFDLKKIEEDSNKTPEFPHFGIIVKTYSEFAHLLKK